MSARATSTIHNSPLNIMDAPYQVKLEEVKVQHTDLKKKEKEDKKEKEEEKDIEKGEPPKIEQIN